MKTFRTVFSLLFLFIVGVFLFIWIEREIDERSERAARPLPDGLHPNEDGYRVWGRAMEPTIKRFLGEEQEG